MAIPGSGPLHMAMFRDEFGGGNPVYMSNMYRGGPLVPNSAGNANVPTSGIFYFSALRNASKASLSAPNINGSTFRNEPAPSSAVVSGSSTASGSGLSGGTWTRLSGSMSPASASGVTLSVSQSVLKNSTSSGSYRFDGNNGLSITISVNLTYSTDL